MNKKRHYTFKYLTLLLFIMFSLNASAVDSDHFVTTWNTTPGAGIIHTVTIPTESGLTYNYSIDWDNDGTFDEFNVAGDASHNYAIPGAKTIRIVGVFPRILINNDTHRLKIISIDQWGTNPWSSMRHAFYGAENLVNNADDTPNLTSTDDLFSMFGGATIIGNGTGNWSWNTTGITNMAYMFELTNFNKSIGSWDTSSVTNFFRIFSGASSFDQDLSGWNVEAATNTYEMFQGVTLSTLNYEALLISWANQNINNSLTFDGGASKYCSQAARTARNSLILSDGLTITDAGLCEEGYFITRWKTDNPGTSNSTSITIPTEDSEIYSYQVDWNGDGDFNDTDENINYSGNATHDYGSVGTYTVKIKGIFPQIYFNNERDKEKILSIEQWGTKAWGSMLRAYQGTSNLSMNAIDAPDLSATMQMGAMFDNTGNLGASTGDWSWDTSNVTGMTGLFSTSTFDFDISSWNVESVNGFGSMFAGSTLSSHNYEALLIAWDAQVLNSGRTFSGGDSRYCSQGAQDAKASIIANDSWTITDGGLDSSCDNSIDTNHFVITFDTTIAGSSDSFSFEIPTTGTGYNYSVDSNNSGTFNFTGLTNNVGLIFPTEGIKTIRIAGDFPRIFFNESGDKDKILSVEQWGTTRWKTMNNAFSGASNLVINAIDTPDLSNVVSIFKMFYGATNLGNGTGVWNWDTSNIIGMSQAFKGAIAFDEDISSWNVENVGNFSGMFSGATLSDDNYDALLISWDAQTLNPGQLFNGGNSKYCSQAAQNSRANIITNDGWMISDGGLNPTCAVNQAPIIISSDTVAIDENTINVVIVTATDPDLDTITYTISGGADSALFMLGSSNGYLQYISVPDFETPASSLGTNTYVVEVTASDNDVSDTQVVTVNVLDVVETTAIDLNLEIINSPNTAIAGALAEYQIQITNVGNQDATDANVIDVLPAELMASSWVCNSTGSATCGTSGTGAIDDMISIPVGSDSVTYTISTTVTNDSFSQIVYQSQVLAASPEFDENLANNTDVVTVVNGDIVFVNSFEAPLLRFAITDKSIQVNFSKISKSIDINPVELAKGTGDYDKTTIWIHIREVENQLQIRMSNKEYGIWLIGQWQDVYNTELTTLYW